MHPHTVPTVPTFCYSNPVFTSSHFKETPLKQSFVSGWELTSSFNDGKLKHGIWNNKGMFHVPHLLSTFCGVRDFYFHFSLFRGGAVLLFTTRLCLGRGAQREMEKISVLFKKTQNVLREKVKNKRAGHRRDHNTAAQQGEENTRPSPDSLGQKGPGAGVHPQSPCGHVVKSSSLVNMVNQRLKQKSLDFSCPVCEEQWSWSQVRGQLQLSQAQTVILDSQVNRIVQDLPDAYKKCPVCLSFLRRPMDSAGRPCPFSSCEHCPHTHHFCWSCLAPWVFPNAASSGQCSNRSCHIVATLLACETVTDTSSSVLGCPVFRACPECYTLITPQPDCKFVGCPECSHRFCYICLDSEMACAEREDPYQSPACKKPRAERQKFVT